MDEDEFPATQPVLPSLLGDVVAFVEVRSGHDNRSKGVISELRSLGASIAPTLNKDVTHVVFQGGHVSVYKKAKQQMMHVVAVSWIEASKELGCKAPESEHPPPGYEKYEDPHAARKIRVLKSMQPDFDNEKDDERLNAILARIKKKGAKRLASTEDEVFTEKSGKKKRATASDKQNESASTVLSGSLDDSVGSKGETEKSKKRGVSAGSKATCSPPKRTRKSSRKGVSSHSWSSDLSCQTDEKIESNNIGEETKTGDSEPSSGGEKNVASRKSFEFVIPKPVKNLNGSTLLTVHVRKKNEVGSSAHEISQKPFEFVMPKPVKIQKGSKLTLPLKKGVPSKTQPSVQTAMSKTSNEMYDQFTKEVQLKPAQSRPLVFIENITREKDESEASQRQTRRSAGKTDPDQGSNQPQPQTKEVNPFVAKVLETLAKRKKPVVYLKSPWRRQNEPMERRQSPRLTALRRKSSSDSEIDENVSPAVPKKTEPRRPGPVIPNCASAHMLKFFKAKPSTVTSPEVALLDISFGPAHLSQKRKSVDSSNASTTSSANTASQPSTPVEQFSKSLLETFSLDLTDLDRSDSPILGTRMKRRVRGADSNISRVSTKSLPVATPLREKSLADTRRRNEDSPSSSVANRSELEEKSGNESLSSSTRLSRRGSGQKKPLSTLVCTHLPGSDVKKVMKAVRDLGKFEFEEQVSERTTHVVASGPRRTINMLRAIARGCWVLRVEWVYRSVKAGRWLPENDFELTEFSPSVKERRLLRESSGLDQWDLLSSVGPIFVSPASQPRPSDLKDLIVLGGGTLSKTADGAALIVGPQTQSSKNKHSKPRVSPVWILDCIQNGAQLPLST